MVSARAILISVGWKREESRYQYFVFRVQLQGEYLKKSSIYCFNYSQRLTFLKISQLWEHCNNFNLLQVIKLKWTYLASSSCCFFLLICPLVNILFLISLIFFDLFAFDWCELFILFVIICLPLSLLSTWFAYQCLIQFRYNALSKPTWLTFIALTRLVLWLILQARFV